MKEPITGTAISDPAITSFVKPVAVFSKSGFSATPSFTAPVEEAKAPATSQKRKLFDDSDDSAAEYEIDLAPQVEEVKEAASTAVYGTETLQKKAGQGTSKTAE